MPELSPPKLSLTVQYASNAARLPTRVQLRRWLKIAFQRDAAATVRIVDEKEGRMINREFSHKDYATNVLTFSYGDADICDGDVVICAPVVEREADEQQKELLAHYAHLVIHAALHMQGYQHESDADAEQMEAMETALMLKLRYPDPYGLANG